MIYNQNEKILVKQQNFNCKKCGAALSSREIANGQTICSNCLCL